MPKLEVFDISAYGKQYPTKKIIQVNQTTPVAVFFSLPKNKQKMLSEKERKKISI